MRKISHFQAFMVFSRLLLTVSISLFSIFRIIKFIVGFLWKMNSCSSQKNVISTIYLPLNSYHIKNKPFSIISLLLKYLVNVFYFFTELNGDGILWISFMLNSGLQKIHMIIKNVKYALSHCCLRQTWSTLSLFFAKISCN